jgi:hypothetical protein
LDAHDRQLDMMRTHNYIKSVAMEQGLKEGIEQGEKLALDKVLILLQEIKLGKSSNEELSSKYNINLNYIEQLRSNTV